MKQSISPALLAIAVMLTAGTAVAADAADGPNFKMLFFHALNIGILFFLLYKFGRGPILDFLAQRSRDIRAQIDAGAERLRQAEAEMAELRRRLDDFESEAQRIVQQVQEGVERPKPRGGSLTFAAWIASPR